MTRREIFFSGIYLVFELFLLPAVLTAVNTALSSPWTAGGVNFLYFLLNFLAVAVILRRFLRQSLLDALRKPRLVLIHALLGAAAYWSMTNVLTQIIVWIEPAFFNINDSSIQQIMTQDFTLMAVGTVLLVPLVEESLFRGLLFGALWERCRCAGWIVSVCAFAAIHVIRYIGSYPPYMLFLCFLQYLPAGFCIAWAYLKADNILAPILIHTAVNAMGMAATR